LQDSIVYSESFVLGAWTWIFRTVPWHFVNSVTVTVIVTVPWPWSWPYRTVTVPWSWPWSWWNFFLNNFYLKKQVFKKTNILNKNYLKKISSRSRSRYGTVMVTITVTVKVRSRSRYGHDHGHDQGTVTVRKVTFTRQERNFHCIKYNK